MQGLIIHISGRWGHFRRPETNNTPLTHDFITKTALLGLMGAVLGIERADMRSQFPVLSEDLLYGVKINGAVKKQSWAFTLRDALHQNDHSPRPMEFVRDPDYTVALCAHGEGSAEKLSLFGLALREGKAHYNPVLGIYNCPAELEWIGDVSFSEVTGPYTTSGFVRRDHSPSIQFNFEHFRLGFERIPTFQDDDWWNPPDRYVEVMYPSDGATISVVGNHYVESDGAKWCLI